MSVSKEKVGQEARTVIPRKFVNFLEDIFHALIGILFVVIALISMIQGFQRFLNSSPLYPNGVIQSVNDLLFVIILLEIMRTIIERFSDGAFQLESFLIIGVIASVRNILSVGASLALRSETKSVDFNHQIEELIVSAGVALVLVGAIWLVRFSKRF